MWRDRKNRKGLNGVNVVYEINGLNQDRLIAELKKRDFTLIDVKKFSNRLMHISVKLNESENFFAITKNLCYNVKKLRLSGKSLPIYNLLTNFGLVIGAVCFLVVALLSNDLIFDFSFDGSGSVYSRQLKEYLEGRGINKFTRFSSFEIENLEDEILSEFPSLTFVSAAKKGNTLAVYSTLKADGVGIITGKSLELLATEQGVVESVKVYRGTAKVNVGDSVEKGDLLVEGFVEIKEQRVQTGVLACVTLLKEKSFTYKLEKGREKEALVLAEEEFPQKEMIKSSVSVIELGEGKGCLYTVTATYRTVIYSQ